jgi:hypothetical protein
MKKQQPEYLMQCLICAYLERQYSKVLFLSDTIASIHLKPQQAVRNKKIQKYDFHTPDLIIFEARNNFHGLFIELKSETPFKKDGNLKASTGDHLLKQAESMKQLIDKGYACYWAWSFDQAKEIIDNYLQ